MLSKFGLLWSLIQVSTFSTAIPTQNDIRLSLPVEVERIEPRANVWIPPMKSNIQFVLTGVPDVTDDDEYITPNAGIYEVDMFWIDKSTIKNMQRLGQKVICYFSAATAENWRDDYKQFQSKDLGKELPDWPGERYLDIRRPHVYEIISKRVQLAKDKGCDAIEPDNVGKLVGDNLSYSARWLTEIDVYSNENGFTPAIEPKDTVAYLHKISTLSRSLGMSVGIKNCIEILGDIFPDVDFAISEECVQYKNCTAYANFTTAPHKDAIAKPVFEVEYINYTYSGRWSEEGVALSPNNFRYTNPAFPGLKDEALRKVLCNLNEPGASLQNPYLKLNTIIKTLELDGFVMFCDGRVERTRTKDVGQRQSYVRERAVQRVRNHMRRVEEMKEG